MDLEQIENSFLPRNKLKVIAIKALLNFMSQCLKFSFSKWV